MEMRRWRSKALFLLILLLCVIALLFQRDPHYHGRSLESWLEHYSRAPLGETQALAEARTAIQAIGAERALPVLLGLVKTHDSRVRDWLSDKADRYGGRLVKVHPATQLQLWGIAGFEMLGSNAAPAVAELTRMLNDAEFAFVAVRCLDQIGKAAELPLCQSLTNQNWLVRHLAVSALASVTDDVEVYLARIKSRLEDTEPGVRFAAVQAIGDQAHVPDLAIPLLIPALADPEDSVCEQAAKALAGFSTNALCAFPALADLAEKGRVGQIRAALRALPSIDPTAAIPVLSNAVVNGDPGAMVIALRTLKAVRPEMALAMTLDAFRAGDAQRRLAAVNAAPVFDLQTSGLPAALKNAASDSDPKIAERATATMRQMVNKQKEQAGYAVFIPGEPSDAGKPLGEWLKQRGPDWGLSTNAVEALRRMGTNAIPALLARLNYHDPLFGFFDAEVSMEAVGAFQYLEDLTQPALPALTQLIKNGEPEVALRAMLATLGAGTSAVPCLIMGLTNESPNVRLTAAGYLTEEWGTQYPEQQKQVVPMLLKLLNDPDQNVRFTVTGGLQRIAPSDY